MRSHVVVVVAAFFAFAVACDEAPQAAPVVSPGAADITVVTTPVGANVVVDGAIVGNGPVTVKLNPGPHRIHAALSGYYPMQDSKIVVERGVAATHTLTLVASH